MESHAQTAESSHKRPRSPTADHAVSSKVPKTHSNHLQINYLARQYPDNLPLVSVDDTMPAIIHLLGEYDGVLHRHESIAGNLGACPLGPILIKRFERLFDGPPQVLKSHGKDGPTVTWLDVVEFAKNKPEQFNLEKSRNGVRVCQFYTKQCRVEISEEDFVLIASGMPQKMIPPQPIIEDEEKELGALEILEKNLQHIIQMADQVSARARQLNHRLKNRRNAIITRRENDASLHSQSRNVTEIWRDANGHVSGNGHASSHPSPSGFVAVNTQRPEGEHTEENSLASQFMFSQNTDNVTMINGQSIKGASPTTRADLMKRFFTTADRHARGYDDATAPVNPQPLPRPRASDPAEYSLYNPTTATTVAIPSTPSSLLPPPKSIHQEKDDGGPFKLEMVARMEELQRGERVIPPCDRCRRLHMDCLKNLTACVGCTKKHAKCSWRDVREEEITAMRAGNTTSTVSHERPDKDRTSANLTPPQFGMGPLPPISAEREHPRQPPLEPEVPAYYYQHRRESAPSAPNLAPGSAVPMELPSNDNSPRRAVSETEKRDRPHIPAGRVLDRPQDEDPDANQRLRQAILDTVDHHTRVAAAVQERERGAERGEHPGVASGGGALPVPGSAPVSGGYDRERERERETDRDRDRRMVHA
ncbi:unnamed protein product [Penicillium nalgiovense]|uniref:Zn(2)-C6 fungal-type domain-containing protein n=1 Tax=Penicillium nalgiovense TaxID=60175 RepID=A0A1V6YR89_PENNA|nr:hypothetical protein PENNAL_c0013G05214 [Penicillium nalgiovense]CAG8001092.1 unnamed protein product [Penicillium nalgiovense]CAG8028594.1 unnamed protein product [Penicillium nalgiovense]CAG8076100.1 unnamed protein product [Penicillium nalgiovense]CAG8092755.1 unnamed protein product [Penicillium nalgiovense]